MKSWGRCSLKIMGLNYESLTASPGGWASALERRCGTGLNCGDSSVKVTGEFSGRSQMKDQRCQMTSGGGAVEARGRRLSRSSRAGYRYGH